MRAVHSRLLDETHLNSPVLEFFKHLPTTWDETRVLKGRIGEYAVIARRKGDDWFIGCLNAGQQRTFDVNLDFLDDTKQYEARVYQDDPMVPTRTKVRIERSSVNRDTMLKAAIGPQGGMAVWIAAGERGN